MKDKLTLVQQLTDKILLLISLYNTGNWNYFITSIVSLIIQFSPIIRKLIRKYKYPNARITSGCPVDLTKCNTLYEKNKKKSPTRIINIYDNILNGYDVEDKIVAYFDKIYLKIKGKYPSICTIYYKNYEDISEHFIYKEDMNCININYNNKKNKI